MSERIPCTGGAGRWPIFDRHGVRIHLGDRLRAQVCIGPYGQTEIIEIEVTEVHWQYCQSPSGTKSRDGRFHSASTEYDFKEHVLRCYRKHEDVEHGHEQWAEIIQKAR